MRLNMLKSVALLLLLAGSFISCERDGFDDDINADPVITMTIYGLFADVYMKGTGTATIDWGDGWKSTYTLYPDEEYVYNGGSKGLTYFSHSYDNEAFRTIRIFGKNITSCEFRNQITTLILSENASLGNLSCSSIMSLTINKNTRLKSLFCGGTLNNRLASLDVSQCAGLEWLRCLGGRLTGLDVSQNINLEWLDCRDNQLTSLTVSNNAALKYLDCRINNLSAAALNSLFEALTTSTTGQSEIMIDYNPGTHFCNRSIATNKGWRIRYKDHNINPEIDPAENCFGKWEYYKRIRHEGTDEYQFNPTGYLELLPDGCWGWYDYETEEYIMAEGRYQLKNRPIIPTEGFSCMLEFEYKPENYVILNRLGINLYGRDATAGLGLVNHNTMVFTMVLNNDVDGWGHLYYYFSRIN